jgi:hypothetical protein
MSDVERFTSLTGQWQDTIADEATTTTAFAEYRPKEPSHFDRMSYVSDLVETLKEVRDQLVAEAPTAYNKRIILIDLYTGDRPADPDDLEGAALTILKATHHVEGGAVEKLRKLLWD